MAPDSQIWRHQLGEAISPGLRRPVLKTAILSCALFTLFTTNLEARTEPVRDSWSELSAPFLAYERSFEEGSIHSVSLSHPTVPHFGPSPAGQSSNRNQIHIPNNQPVVQKYVHYYHGPGKATFMSSLECSWPYITAMSQILEANGVPPEMVYVVLVESCFKGKACWRGAGGYWQLLASTARTMGLRVDRWVDERMDPIKSTEAAARYLRRFHKDYGCWLLALAAYNCGDGPVSRAMGNRSGGDFWSLYRAGRLPGRTRAYVPKVLAAIQVARDLQAQGFQRPKHHPTYDFESIWVKAPLKLEQVARWIDVPVGDLETLNPSLRMFRVPPDSGFDLRLPYGARAKFDLAYEDYLRE